MRRGNPKVLAATLAILMPFALGIAGCGESSADKRAEHEFNRGLKYEVAEQVIEEEGFSHAAAQEARETGEEQGLSPKETAEMGAIAKQMSP
jgi:hypothetical protein